MITLLLACLVLTLTNISFAALAALHWVRAEIAQREIVRLVAQQRQREPAAGYDTGLAEIKRAT